MRYPIFKFEMDKFYEMQLKYNNPLRGKTKDGGRAWIGFSISVRESGEDSEERRFLFASPNLAKLILELQIPTREKFLIQKVRTNGNGFCHFRLHFQNSTYETIDRRR